MCKLIFNYGTMNSGKSMLLLAKAYNFDERGIPYRIYKSAVDTRDKGVIHSRPIGDKPCCTIKANESFFSKEDWYNTDVKWLLVDEAQFLTEYQVDELAEIVDQCGINVICYGLRTDFQTHFFPGSKRLMELADSMTEIKTVCACGKKATVNARIDENGNIVYRGNQVMLGGNDSYVAMCHKCWKEGRKIQRSK